MAEKIELLSVIEHEGMKFVVKHWDKRAMRNGVQLTLTCQDLATFLRETELVIEGDFTEVSDAVFTMPKLLAGPDQ